MRKFVVLLTLFGFLQKVSTETVYECPSDWQTYRGYCYKFVSDIPQTYDNARAKCNMHGAGLLSVDSTQEHEYIRRWIASNNVYEQEWYTSGVLDTSKRFTGVEFVWANTGRPVEVSILKAAFIEGQPNTAGDSTIIVYSLGPSGYGWKLSENTKELPYICKISEAEAYRIIITDRGHDYGIEGVDEKNLDRGPHFIVQPRSVVVVSEQDKRSEPVVLECVVVAKPDATYRWLKGDNLDIVISKDLDNRYVITNGKLMIDNPNEEKDSGKYRCEAQNTYGKIISNVVEVTFGSLGEFTNVNDAKTVASAYEGATVECSQINFKPAVSYNWVKGDYQQFIRTDSQDYIFMSRNGKLYFSEVTDKDDAEYRCLVTLTGVNKYTIGTRQPPMRTSLPIRLQVTNQAPLDDWGPEIQNDFIAVFPRPPLKGQDIRMECFAYGSSTSRFYYKWSREGKPMPSTTKYYDHNRIIVIVDAKLEDNGVYRCSVSRGTQATDSKTVRLDMGATPYFVSELRDQHVDIGSQLTWICNARGSPEPRYEWYKDGKLITRSTGNGIQVSKNVLTIKKLDGELHNGMYQCGAFNDHGISLTSGQLRVLGFKPSLNKNPLPASLFTSEGNDLKIPCQPEGAPYPTIEWFHNGNQISSDDKFTILANGNLLIKEVTINEKGTYTCRATNSYGEAQGSSEVDTTGQLSIIKAPTDTKVRTNETAFLACEANFPPNIDMVYAWYFNGFPVRFDDGHHSLEERSSSIGLYVKMAQFKHEGQYTCKATTPFSSVSAAAYLTVLGPPRQPAGVYIISEKASTDTAAIVWTPGGDSGAQISTYDIEAATIWEPDTWESKLIVNAAESAPIDGDGKGGRYGFDVPNLNPGTGYRFRVTALNEYGRGIPSDPSTYYQTLSAPPIVYPHNLRGGGGSIGELTIRWDPLTPAEYGAATVEYRVYFRRPSRGVEKKLWGVKTVKNPEESFVVELVGPDNYYLVYEVMIQAYNVKGEGPNSTVVEVYSAESLPLASPQNVNTDTYNSTAIEVFWDPVPDDRQNVRGKIQGYQINYWNEEDDPNTGSQSINYYGQRDSGLVIGLEVDVNIVIDVQVYNSAGLGPRSNQYIMETSGFAPLTYPQEVRVTSAGRNRARVWWRGITLTVEEEALEGWAIWLWTASEDARAAELYEFDANVFDVVLDNIEDNRLYAMRIAGIGGGGYGKKTPTTYFTMEGQIFIDYNFAQTIDAFMSEASQNFISRSTVILSVLSSLVATLYTNS